MLYIRFNLIGGKVNDDQATERPDLDVKTTSGRVRFYRQGENTNTKETHKETADSAERTLTGK